jgi:hypothetical protein
MCGFDVAAAGSVMSLANRGRRNDAVTLLNARQRDAVTRVRNAGTSPLAIINGIPESSMIEAGKLDPETADVRLDEVLASGAGCIVPRQFRKPRA